MTIYNSTTRVITYRDPKSTRRYKFQPGANEGIPEGVWKNIRELMPGHVENGDLTESSEKAAERKAKVEGARSARGKKAAERKADEEAEGGGSGDTKVSEIFDLDELKRLRAATKDKKEIAAIDAQIKIVKKG